MIDLRQTPEYANHLKNIGWIVEEKSGVYYFIRKLPLIGSIIKIQRPQKIDYQYIDVLAVKYRAFQIIIEPALSSAYSVHNLLISQGFRLSKSPYLPTKTLQIDLIQTKEDLFNQLKKDTRYALKKASMLNAKIQILNYEDIEEFRKSWKKSVGLKRQIPSLSNLKSLNKSFRDKCLILHHTSVIVQNKGINQQEKHTPTQGGSGAIFLMGDKTAYYWQAFTDKEGRRNLSQYKIVWEGILWAKSKGAKIFDFEGIYDERFPNKSWLGFTHFKKSFGGIEIEYPGAFTKLRLPV